MLLIIEIQFTTVNHYCVTLDFTTVNHYCVTLELTLAVNHYCITPDLTLALITSGTDPSEPHSLNVSSVDNATSGLHCNAAANRGRNGYNGRHLIGWLRDINDKFEKLKVCAQSKIN